MSQLAAIILIFALSPNGLEIWVRFERLQYAFDFYASNNAEQGGFLTFANFTALLVSHEELQSIGISAKIIF